VNIEHSAPVEPDEPDDALVVFDELDELAAVVLLPPVTACVPPVAPLDFELDEPHAPSTITATATIDATNERFMEIPAPSPTDRRPTGRGARKLAVRQLATVSQRS
jgi:hypothetical protein